MATKSCAYPSCLEPARKYSLYCSRHSDTGDAAQKKTAKKTVRKPAKKAVKKSAKKPVRKR